MLPFFTVAVFRFVSTYGLLILSVFMSCTLTISMVYDRNSGIYSRQTADRGMCASSMASSERFSCVIEPEREHMYHNIIFM